MSNDLLIQHIHAMEQQGASQEEIQAYLDGKKPLEKYIFFTFENEGMPIAEKLIKEGNQVIVGEVHDTKDLLTQGELDKAEPEEPEYKKRRLEKYKGIVKKRPIEEVIKIMKGIKNKDDYFVFCDLNHVFKFATQAVEMGFTKGLFPTEEDRELEVERNTAKDIVKKHYKDLEIGDVHEFKDAKEGIQFLEEQQDKIFVLKSLGDSGETVVPKIDNPELANQQLIDCLEKNTKAYEENGFIFEEKVMHPIELTPQLVFWNGEPVYATLDIETKTLGSGEVGPNVGCGINLVIDIPIDDPLCKMAFPKYVYDQAKKHKGMFVWDAGVLFDKKGAAYFTEFCANRVGWDAFPTEVAMSGDPDGERIASPYFERLMQGENPLRFKFGAAVRLFNLEHDKERYTKGGLSITVDERAEPDVYLYDAKKEDDKIVTTGSDKDLGVVTGVGNSIKEAIDRCYEYVEMVGVKNVFYRTKDDFMSFLYSQSILNRLFYAVEKGLITDDGISEELKELMKENGKDKRKELKEKINAQLQY